jgi:signal transduction histidine kinase
LARDLHDGFGSVLASLNLRAGAIRALIARDPTAASALAAEQQDTIRAAIGDVRRLVHDLRPPVLDERGLVAAVRELVARLTAVNDDSVGGSGHPVRITVEAAQPLPPLPAAVEAAAYRIAQEALTNVVRHARACTCRVHLGSQPDALQLEVTDDGVGLPEACPAGVGLLSMRERAQELGGTCRVERRDVGGTRVLAWLPLAN